VVEPRRLAVNVEPREGDLALADSAALLAKLAPVRASFGHYDDDLGAGDASSNNFSLLLMGVLIALLLGEQLLAYSASYHSLSPPVRS
jgi:hypothetical protein